MSKIKWFIIFSLLLMCTSLKAKNYNFGLRLEFYSYNLKKVRNDNSESSEMSFSYLPSFYIFYSRQITDELSISFKPGIIISDKEVSSYDLGLFLRMKLPNEKFYLNGGLNALFFRNDGNSTGIIESIESNANYFLSLGTGYIITKHFSIDFSYYHPLNIKIGTRYDSMNYSRSPINLYNIIKLSLEFRI